MAEVPIIGPSLPARIGAARPHQSVGASCWARGSSAGTMLPGCDLATVLARISIHLVLPVLHTQPYCASSSSCAQSRMTSLCKRWELRTLWSHRNSWIAGERFDEHELPLSRVRSVTFPLSLVA
eukprot:4880969-Amphidinium_carterae.1